MAVNKIVKSSRLVLQVQTGLKADGTAASKERSFSNVKIDALDADVYAVAQGLAGLQKNPVLAVFRVDEGEMINV